MNAPEKYTAAGVNIAAGDSFVSGIASSVEQTYKTLASHGAEMMLATGGFAAAVELPKGMEEPVLLTCTDGVGTKVKLAGHGVAWQAIGYDAVAMCVNDLLCTGAQPLAFLDYYACDVLDAESASLVVSGIANACSQANCALVGGETAEMPGVYAAGCFDVAGFAVGVIEKKDMIKPERVLADDVIIGLASTGPHSNGYSLIRQILKNNPESTPPAEMFAATRIYCRSIAALSAHRLHGIAHITGGGLANNLARVLPLGVNAVLNPFPLPEVFSWLQKHGNISDDEMHRVFNCGVGLAVIAAAADEDEILQTLAANNERAWRLGIIQKAKDNSDKPLVLWD